MKAIGLMYHDVVDSRSADTSGFVGPDADLYKLDRECFADHLRVLAEVLPTNPQRVTDHLPRDATPVYLTFDDGGVSAHTRTADMLEERGWRGHFFVTGGAVGTSGFLSPAEIRELGDRGHVVGSHSWSHPLRMARCDRSTLLEEWSRSKTFLEELLGAPVNTASVPGGYYARRVAEAAAEAGIEALFTSEPIVRTRRIGSCRVFGRFTVQRWTSASMAAALATGRMAPAARQYLLWNAKKLVKIVGGNRYLEIRRRLLTEEQSGEPGPLST
jgi:peptidoglycan/xylan/chitin deacetylase (PgdA/CDA1 family)